MEEDNFKTNESDSENISDGMMAMTAWMKMQFPDIGNDERDIFKSLLRYCG